MSSREKNIGLVGVGRMGANMARNLNDKGYRLSCVNDVAVSYTHLTLPTNREV